MIKVNVLYKNSILDNIEIKGHAGYDDYGKDIVCSAVSSISTTTINNIITLDKNAIKYDAKDGNINITILNGNEIALKLLNNMLNMLKELANDYPNNIKIGGLQ